MEPNSASGQRAVNITAEKTSKCTTFNLTTDVNVVVVGGGGDGDATAVGVFSGYRDNS